MNKNFRSCEDGYPTCRILEMGKSCCKNGCTVAMQDELEKLLEERTQTTLKYFDKLHKGEMSRAKTTTYNARTSQLNERIAWIREQIKLNN
ncbi:MAG TPA: hypothetical protein V6C58_00680 [Allocoleopsis sp.]